MEEALKIERKSDDSKMQRQRRDFVQSSDTKAKISGDELSSASSNEAQTRKIRVPQAGNGQGVNLPVLKWDNMDSLQGWIKDTNKTVHNIQRCLVEVKGGLSALSERFERFLMINCEEEVKNETELDCKTIQANNTQRQRQRYEQKHHQQQQQQQQQERQQPMQDQQQPGHQQTEQQQQQIEDQQNPQQHQHQNNSKLATDGQSRDAHEPTQYQDIDHRTNLSTLENAVETKQSEDKEPQVESKTFHPSGNEVNGENQKQRADNTTFGDVAENIAEYASETEPLKEKRLPDNDSGTAFCDNIGGKLPNTDIGVYEMVYDAAKQLECTLSRFLDCFDGLRSSKTVGERTIDQEKLQMGDHKEGRHISERKHELCGTNGWLENTMDCLFRQIPNHQIPSHSCRNGSFVDNHTLHRMGTFSNGCKCACHLQANQDNDTSVSSGYKSEDASSGCMGSISRWDKAGAQSNPQQDKASVTECVLVCRGLKDWGLNGKDYVQRHIVTSSPIIASLRDLKPHEI